MTHIEFETMDGMKIIVPINRIILSEGGIYKSIKIIGDESYVISGPEYCRLCREIAPAINLDTTEEDE